MKKWFGKRRAGKGEPVDAVAEIDAQAKPLQDDRRPPDLDAGSRALAPGAKGFLVFLIVVAIVLLGVLLMRLVGDNEGSKESSRRRPSIGMTVPALTITPPQPVIVESSPKPEPEPVKNIFAQVPLPEPRLDSPSDPVEERRMMAGLQGQGHPGQSGRDGRTGSSEAHQDTGPMADQLQPLRLTAAKAGLLANRDLLLTQGAMIDCVQQTRFVSAQAGMITCYATREVRSASGRVVLIDPGTIFTGYQRNVLAHGQPRIGVVWSRLETPDGVVVYLDSPATGPLGEGGLDGQIDTHFAARFGGAIMISLIDDFGEWLSRRGSSQTNDNITFSNSSDAAQEAITTVLDNSINIPPTLYRNQGERVGIYVARDLDFSSVYELQPSQSAFARRP